MPLYLPSSFSPSQGRAMTWKCWSLLVHVTHWWQEMWSLAVNILFVIGNIAVVKWWFFWLKRPFSLCYRESSRWWSPEVRHLLQQPGSDWEGVAGTSSAGGRCWNHAASLLLSKAAHPQGKIQRGKAAWVRQGCSSRVPLLNCRKSHFSPRLQQVVQKGSRNQAWQSTFKELKRVCESLGVKLELFWVAS